MCLTAFEQPGEQALEMLVHFLERGAQAFAPLAVEVADRAAQPVDRLDQLGLLGRAGPGLLFDPRQLLRRDEVDRPDPLARGDKAVHVVRFQPGVANALGLEGEALRQQRGRRLEPLAGNACHLAPPRFLVLGPGGEPGAVFARTGERFGRLGQRAVGQSGGLLRFGHRRLRSCQIGGDPGADGVALLDLAHKRGGFGRDHCLLLLDFLESLRHPGQPPRRFGRARLPPGNVGALGRSPFARHGQRLVVRGKPGHRRLLRHPRSFVAGLRRFQRGAASGGIGQRGLAFARRLKLSFGSQTLFGEILRRPVEFGQPPGEPLAFSLGLVDRAKGLPLGIGGGGETALGRYQRALQLGQLGLDPGLLRLGRIDPGNQRCQLRGEVGKAVVRLQPCRFRRAFAPGDEPVPPAQVPGERDQPFARRERAPVILGHDPHQRQPHGQFGRAVGDVAEQAVGERLRRATAGPEPAIALGRAQRCLGIAPQHRGERALIPALGTHRVDRRAPPGAPRGLPLARLAVTLQRSVLALDPCQFRTGGGERTGRLVAAGLQAFLVGPLPVERVADRSQRAGRLVRGVPGGGELCLQVARLCQRLPRLGLSPGFSVKPGEARLGLVDRRLRDAPFRLDPGVVGGSLGQRQFGGASGALAVFDLRGEGGAAGFVLGQRGLPDGEFALQPGERLGGVVRQPVGLAAILLQPGLLPVEIREPLFGGFDSTGTAGAVVLVGKYAVFGSSAGALRTLLLELAAGKGLRPPPPVLAHGQRAATLTLYVNTANAWGLLQRGLVPARRTDALRNETLLRRFPSAVWQMSRPEASAAAAGGSWYTTLAVQHAAGGETGPGTDAPAAGGPVATTAVPFEQPLTAPPVLVRGGVGGPDVVVQDAAHVLHAVDAAGRVVWHDTLAGPLAGPVLRTPTGEGRPRLLLATAARLYALEAPTGFDVDNFPFYLSDSLRIQHLAAFTAAAPDIKLFVDDPTGNLYGFDAQGRALAGWQPRDLGAALADAPRALRVEGRDLLVAALANGDVYLLDHTGGVLPGFPVSAGGPLGTGALAVVPAPTLRATRVSVVTTTGRLTTFSGRGEVLLQRALPRPDDGRARFELVPFDNGTAGVPPSGEFVVSRQEPNRVTLYDPETGAARLTRAFLTAAPKVVQAFRLTGGGGTVLALTERGPGRCYLFDERGRPLGVRVLDADGPIALTYNPQTGDVVAWTTTGKTLRRFVFRR